MKPVKLDKVHTEFVPDPLTNELRDSFTSKQYDLILVDNILSITAKSSSSETLVSFDRVVWSVRSKP